MSSFAGALNLAGLSTSLYYVHVIDLVQLRLPICSVDVPDGAVLAWRSAAPSGNWHDAAGLFSLQDARLQRGPLTDALSQARRVWLSKTRDLSVPYVTPPCAPVCVCANLK